MVCAGAADHDDASSDTCQGDSGGPLLVDDGSALVTAGVVSWGNGCNQTGFPGIYTRIGAPALNAWVARTAPRRRLHGPDRRRRAPACRCPFAAPSAPGSISFSWDFDDNGTSDATGASVSHVYPGAGIFEPVLRVTDPEGQPAEQLRAIASAPAAVSPPPASPSPAPPAGMGRRHSPVRSARPGLATILAFGRPKVRRGRFKLRISFDRDRASRYRHDRGLPREARSAARSTESAAAARAR